MIGPVKKIPEILMYQRHIETYNHARDEFVMFSTKDCQEKGIMVCHKINIPFRDDYNGNSLGIDFITTHEKRKGYGTKFLDFAKIFSKQIGCNGFICLKADGSLLPTQAPHQFYRKNGFTTLDKEFDKKIDSFNKKKKQGTYKDFRAKLMFFPAPQNKKTNCLKNFWEQILRFLHPHVIINS